MLKKLKRLLIGVGCLLFFALAFPVLGKEQSKKPANTPDGIQKITLIHYAKGSNNSNMPPFDETEDNYKFLFSWRELKWQETMEYKVDPSECNLEASKVMGILGKSLETWDDKTGDELFSEPTPLTGELPPGVNDGENIVVWNDLGDGGIIAVNHLWVNIEEDAIIDSDVEFNTRYAWGDCLGEEEVCLDNKVMDLQNIATHEFGHNGLGDLYSRPSMALTMYGRSGYGETDKRDLGNGDVLGIQALYGGL